MAKEQNTERVVLEIPLDASGIEGREPGAVVKVAIQARDGSIRSQRVKFNKQGLGSATFTFEKEPGSLGVIVGPEDTSDEELAGLQTIHLDIAARQWQDNPNLKLAPILIPPYYWYWWRRWCRTFTVRGRVVCPDGSPVPGAKVCAKDVDWWWWWSSEQTVGCDVTDATGAFEITFRWCCGWWPWWWWKLRVWKLVPELADLILPVLREKLELARIPIPDPRPDPIIFEELLQEDRFIPPPPPIAAKRQDLAASLGEARQIARLPRRMIEPAALEGLRERLLDRLPIIPELEQLHLWPWWPWQPWWDCTPDLIFQVTQDCEQADTVIVDEGIWDTHWNIPTDFDVTLVANNQACCIPPQDNPEGVCMVITHACDDQVQYIGGNPTAPLTPAGYLNPGLIDKHGDRPYAGKVPIRGLFGDLANVDYYEFEWSDDGGATWQAMPPAAAGGFTRYYWGPLLGGGPLGFHPVTFSFSNISGQYVVESLEHFQAQNEPLSWGMTRFWTHRRDWLMHWLTNNNFADGTYWLRVRSWDLDAGGNLVNSRILPLCDTNDDNGLVLTIDNRLTGPGSGHPTAPDHPCGAGTVHTCTTEPDTDLIEVRINGVAVGPCDIVDASAGGTLEIDFMAHDPDGHLAYYTFIATYQENLYRNLLTQPSASLASGPMGAPVPPALQVGPTYAHARIQGAVAPSWTGGTLTLTIGDLSQAFPISCAYQLELRAYKRTIANCDDNWPHRNLSEFSLTIIR